MAIRPISINLYETNPDITWGVVEMLEKRNYLCTRHCDEQHHLLVINHVTPFSYFYSDDNHFGNVNYKVILPKEFDELFDRLNELCLPKQLSND